MNTFCELVWLFPYKLPCCAITSVNADIWSTPLHKVSPVNLLGMLGRWLTGQYIPYLLIEKQIKLDVQNHMSHTTKYCLTPTQLKSKCMQSIQHSPIKLVEFTEATHEASCFKPHTLCSAYTLIPFDFFEEFPRSSRVSFQSKNVILWGTRKQSSKTFDYHTR